MLKSEHDNFNIMDPEPSEKITNKVLYIKMVSLIDQSKNEDRPLMYRKVPRLGKKIPVYDEAIFIQFTKFGTKKDSKHQWRFTSAKGVVDALQIFPFAPPTENPDPSDKYNDKSIQKIISTKSTDNLVVIDHHFNGFQKGESGEWAGVRADNDTDELRLVIDFSSIKTLNEMDLFVEKPKGTIRQTKNSEKESELNSIPIPNDFSTDRLFSFVKNNVTMGDVLFVKWKINWDNLSN